MEPSLFINLLQLVRIKKKQHKKYKWHLSTPLEAESLFLFAVFNYTGTSPHSLAQSEDTPTLMNSIRLFLTFSLLIKKQMCRYDVWVWVADEKGVWFDSSHKNQTVFRDFTRNPCSFQKRKREVWKKRWKLEVCIWNSPQITRETHISGCKAWNWM